MSQLAAMEHEGYYYALKANRKNGGKYYICKYRKKFFCKGSISVETGTITPLQPHNHAPNILDQRNIFRQKLKERSQSEYKKLKEIYDEEALLNEEASCTYPFSIAESSMRKARKAVTPPIPSELKDLGTILMNELNSRYTCHDKNICAATIINSNDNNMTSLIFCCQELINSVLLYGVEEIHGDGTFKVVPSLPKSRQLFTIHCIVRNHTVPLVYALMSSRSKEAYKDVILYFKEHLAPTLIPNIIITDFESALQSAFSECYETADVVGCHFHYSQAVWKKMRYLGLLQYTSDNEAALKVVKMLMVLPFLPSDEIEQGFEEIKTFCERNNVLGMNVLFDYVQSFWIAPQRRRRLSVYGMPRRTNNNIESFHNSLKQKIGICHPNIWEFLDKLTNNIIKDSHILISQLAGGYRISRRPKNKYICNDAHIKDAQSQYDRRLINIFEFLNLCSHSMDTFERNQRNWAQQAHNVLENDDDEEEILIDITNENNVGIFENNSQLDQIDHHDENIFRMELDLSPMDFNEDDFWIPEDEWEADWADSGENNREVVREPEWNCQEEDEDAIEGEQACGSCTIYIRKFALICGHMLCATCAAYLFNHFGLCPFCRQPIITQPIRIFANV